MNMIDYPSLKILLSPNLLLLLGWWWLQRAHQTNHLLVCCFFVKHIWLLKPFNQFQTLMGSWGFGPSKKRGRVLWEIIMLAFSFRGRGVDSEIEQLFLRDELFMASILAWINVSLINWNLQTNESHEVTTSHLYRCWSSLNGGPINEKPMEDQNGFLHPKGYINWIWMVWLSGGYLKWMGNKCSIKSSCPYQG